MMEQMESSKLQYWKFNVEVLAANQRNGEHSFFGIVNDVDFETILKIYESMMNRIIISELNKPFH